MIRFESESEAYIHMVLGLILLSIDVCDIPRSVRKFECFQV